MVHTVEISLKIPSLRVYREGVGSPEVIANGDIRFSKQVEIDVIPKAGAPLIMTLSSGGTFECAVVSSNWHHGKDMFVVACRYSRRSISPADYQALLDSTDWHSRPLL